jgi:hypothetical protein
MPPMHQPENENENGQRKKIWQESIVHDSAPATRFDQEARRDGIGAFSLNLRMV